MRYFKQNNGGIIEAYDVNLTEAELNHILTYAAEITEAEYKDLVRTAKENFEKNKTVEQKLNELKSGHKKNKNNLIDEYKSLLTIADLKGDSDLIKELKDDFSEDLKELEEQYIKDLEELKDGN